MSLGMPSAPKRLYRDRTGPFRLATIGYSELRPTVYHPNPSTRIRSVYGKHAHYSTFAT